MFKQKFYLVVFGVYQLFSTLLIAIGSWPAQMVLVNLAIQLLALFLFDLEYALYSAIISIPFYLAIPNSRFDALSAWRFVFVALFLVFVYRRRGEIRRYVPKMDFASWDKYLALFAVVAFFSILEAKFKILGIKKLAFVVNIYLLYVVARSVIKTKEQLMRALTVAFSSLATIVLIGFIQFGATFTASTYGFWQYWALVISKAYYGVALSNTLTYSNSWFSFYAGQAPSLRMFSILPDSHAFALVAAFSIPFAGALLLSVRARYQKILLWIFIVLASLAISLSGTRGVWVAVLVPLALLAYLYFKRFGRKLALPIAIPMLLFLFFLVSSPLIQKTITALTAGHNYGNFIQRAESIYDIGEASNAGRIAIWKNDLAYLLHNPLLGTGYGNFITSLPQSQVAQSDNYQELANQNDKQYNLPAKYITAHSLYGDILVETGILGFIAFALYFWDILGRIWGFFKKYYLYAEDPFVFFAVSVGAYIVWLLAYSVFDGTLLNDRVLMYFFLLLAFAATAMDIRRSESSVEVKP